MTRNELFEAYLKIGNFWAKRHDERRQYEWKLTIGLWAIIVAGLVQPDKLRVLPETAIRLTLLGIWILYCFGWLLPLWERNNSDKRQALDAIEECNKLLDDASYQPRPPKRPKKPPVRKFIGDWAMRFQALATGVLLLLLSSIITR